MSRPLDGISYRLRRNSAPPGAGLIDRWSSRAECAADADRAHRLADGAMVQTQARFADVVTNALLHASGPVTSTSRSGAGW